MPLRVFKLGRTGPAATLGPLEGEVMECLWSVGRPATVSEIVEALERRGNPAAYSTVKTILTNLAFKKYLSKRSAGRANQFEPRLTRAQFENELVSGVVTSLMREYRNPLLAHMAEELAADPAAVAEFEALLSNRKKGRRSHA
jgi:predicted transcriptional regulator